MSRLEDMMKARSEHREVRRKLQSDDFELV